MGMMFGNIHSSSTGSYPIYNRNGSAAGTVSVSRSRGKSEKSKKRLSYRYKEISALILRAKTSGNAGQAVIKARTRAASLRQKLYSGEYDDQELKDAIIHADKMVRIAKKRQKHLKEEENAKRSGDLENELEQEEKFDEDIQAALEDGLDLEDGMAFNEEELREYKKELQKQMQEMVKEYQKQMQEEMQDLMQEMEEEDGISDLAEELGQMDRVSGKSKDLEELKRKHRQEELRDIIKADMEYLKAFFGRLEKEKQEASSGSGVSLELGGMEMPVETPEAPPIALEGVSIDTVL